MARFEEKKCGCRFSVARRTSWTHDNLGRKFFACKFFNHEIGQRGSNTFEWVDEHILDWQRDVTNVLIASRRLSTDLSIHKARLACNEHEKDRLASELNMLKKNNYYKTNWGLREE
uniref:GRF-type domain-containing protein n=1 Tax=Chenopodium quinoa TaxID=63459 RepID=A0A803LJJ4_CHEQI